eukprot:jgi/Ulvmu1/11234/UM073_0006.1
MLLCVPVLRYYSTFATTSRRHDYCADCCSERPRSQSCLHSALVALEGYERLLQCKGFVQQRAAHGLPVRMHTIRASSAVLHGLRSHDLSIDQTLLRACGNLSQDLKWASNSLFSVLLAGRMNENEFVRSTMACARPYTSRATSPITSTPSSLPPAWCRGIASAICASVSNSGTRLHDDKSGRQLNWSQGGSRAGVSVAAADIRSGMLLDHEGKLLEVLSQMHNAGQARQGGNVMLDCRDVRTSSKTKLKVATSKMLEVAETSKRRLQFLYQDEDGLHVMDTTTFEQFAVPHAAATRVQDWLQDGLELYALMHDDVPVVLDVPQAPIEVQVASCAEARVSASGGRKPAVVTTGATVMVPSFVQHGETILVNPSTGEFVRRA